MSSKYAVVNVFGRQIRVKEGETIKAAFCVEKNVGDKVDFSEVLLLSDGSATKVGAPVVAGAKVSATVAAHGRDAKVLVFKYLRKNRHKKKVGHRQPFTTLTIDKIQG